MSKHIHKQIVALKIHTATGSDIGELNAEAYKSKYITRTLPQYCLNTKSGSIMGDAEYYLQYIESGDEIYYLFDLIYSDYFISEEISGCGFEDLLQGYDFRPLFKKLDLAPYKDAWKSCCDYTRLLFNVTYICTEDHYSGGKDCDVNITLEGYFNEQLILIPIE